MDEDTDWTLVDFEPPMRQKKTNGGPMTYSHCPKCGKPLKPRGQHFHIRSCKGMDDGRD